VGDGSGLIAAGDAPAVQWREGVRSRLHRTASLAPAGLCVLEQWCDPGTGAPSHVHANAEELIVVLEGTAEFSLGDARPVARAGDSVLVAPGRPHAFRNAGAGTLHTLAVFDAARPQVEYEHDPGVVLEIGGAGAVMLDAHRARLPGPASREPAAGGS
jgi:oxalate decarboxylase/phosphoglucose isomerase-like protein (cupin superfamily)